MLLAFGVQGFRLSGILWVQGLGFREESAQGVYEDFPALRDTRATPHPFPGSRPIGPPTTICTNSQTIGPRICPFIVGLIMIKLC